MRWRLALLLYRLALPLLFVAAFPGWLLKMRRRGGFGSGLGERLALYRAEKSTEPRHAVHVHAVSVGEALVALKLIRAWRELDAAAGFVLATGTATGHAVATAAALPGLRVTYAPLDFPSMVRRYLDRFRPERIVLIEGDVWPHLLIACRSRTIPAALVNARMSPRSARRYRKFAGWLKPLFAMLDIVAIQDADDAQTWRELGANPDHIHHTGSIKFDPAGGAAPVRKAEFQEMLDTFGANRRVVLAASTHPGEDAWLASCIRAAAPDALPVIVPRHAERRAEVREELEQSGFHVVQRSRFAAPGAAGDRSCVFLIDSTGELRDWTAHADVVIIGKSFRSTGGQNPSEAILAGKPLICGPHMENFQPLADRLAAAGGCLRATDETSLQQAIRAALDPQRAAEITASGARVLATHEGATRRVIDLLQATQRS